MAKREKKTIISGITSEQMEEAMAVYATCDAEIAKINAQMDAQFTKIREKYADRLNELVADKTKSFDLVQVWAVENRDVLFSKKKSIENAHGLLGFRIGTPKLKTKKGFTWAAVLELLKQNGPEFIRTTEDVKKDKLLADREQPEVIELMPKVGVEVVQDETFYIELKKEESDG